MIEIKSVTKSYSEKPVLNNVSLTVEDSSVFGLAGFNGCGKTTLLNICAGIFQPDSGSVLLDGQNAFNNPVQRQYLFYVSDNMWFPMGSSIKTAAQYYSKYFPEYDFRLLGEICDLFGLNMKKPIKSFSKGMTRQAGLAIAFAAKPRYLLIDETFDGLDPHKKEILRKILLQFITEKESSVIISSHDLREISGVCDHIAIINGADIILNCAIEDISEHFRKVYMTFEHPMNEIHFSNINHRNLKLSGRAVSMTICGDVEAEINKLNQLNPLTTDIQLLSLEEVFSEETEASTDNEKIKNLFK